MTAVLQIILNHSSGTTTLCQKVADGVGVVPILVHEPWTVRRRFMGLSTAKCKLILYICEMYFSKMALRYFFFSIIYIIRIETRVLRGMYYCTCSWTEEGKRIVSIIREKINPTCTLIVYVPIGGSRIAQGTSGNEAQ